MTAVVAQPMTRRQVPVRHGRRVTRRVATTAPEVRRSHPAAPSRRPVGAPAPTLRRGALPGHLQLSPHPTRVAGSAVSTGGWRLTDRAIRLIFAVLVILMLTSLAVVVGKLVQVTSPAATAVAATVSVATAH